MQKRTKRIAMPSYVMFLLRKINTILLCVNLFNWNVIRMFLKTIFDKSININLQIKAERYKKYPIRDPRKIMLYTRTTIFLSLALPWTALERREGSDLGVVGRPRANHGQAWKLLGHMGHQRKHNRATTDNPYALDPRV